jgi:methylase of polypeptide subunit release factors
MTQQDSSLEELHHCLKTVAEEFGQDGSISEAELVNRWFQAGVFDALGYGHYRDDYRIELTVPGVGRLDLVLRSIGQRARAVIEFKRPLTDLHIYTGQLADYVAGFAPEFAVLTNGKDLWLYRSPQPGVTQPLASQPQRYDLASLTRDGARRRLDALRRRHFDFRQLTSVEEAVAEIRSAQISVEGPASPGGLAFLERFQLGERTAFGRLVATLFDALPELEGTSQFTRGAYGFWQRVYARNLSSADAPTSWRPFLPSPVSTPDVLRFMFSLESAYTVLARAMLLKAMEDAGFPDTEALNQFAGAARARHRHGSLAASDQIGIVSDVFRHGARQGFTSLFSTDIFDWWSDGNLLADPTDLAEAITETILGAFGFDFSKLEGDVLGDLYQDYFDPETRLALGEFYTPPEVVEFILDSIHYTGDRTKTTRLLDPACGSGSFLVGALRRFLNAQQDEDERQLLTRLIRGLQIVGLDVNPFATLLAQVNYAAHLLPLYASALRHGPLDLPELPVYRTDSLRFERREQETEVADYQRSNQASIQLDLTYSAQWAGIRTLLPIQSDGQFLEFVLPVPRQDLAKEQGLALNQEEYAVILSALFDAVQSGDDRPTLEDRLSALRVSLPTEVAAFLWPTLTELRSRVEVLRTKYEDGRFLKTLRELAVSVVVKNELTFDYVVGNPPYVRVQRLPDELKSYWAGQYDWVHGNFDLYMPFLERATRSWLREGGQLAFICSNRFLVANYGEELRAQILSQVTPELILDLRDTTVFRSATNYPAVLVFRKESSVGQSFVAGRAFARGRPISQVLEEARSILALSVDTNEYARGN